MNMYSADSDRDYMEFLNPTEAPVPCPDCGDADCQCRVEPPSNGDGREGLEDVPVCSECHLDPIACDCDWYTGMVRTINSTLLPGDYTGWNREGL